MAAIPIYLLAALSSAQPRVSLRDTHERIIAIVPMTGAGAAADPRRPMFTPARQAMPAAPDRASLLAWSYVPSDDGKWAIVEFVARDRAAFAPLLANKSYKIFEKGKAKRADVEAELRKHRKDFDLKQFGVSLL
jgi:hypothetical protein